MNFWLVSQPNRRSRKANDISLSPFSSISLQEKVFYVGMEIASTLRLFGEERKVAVAGQWASAWRFGDGTVQAPFQALLVLSILSPRFTERTKGASRSTSGPRSQHHHPGKDTLAVRTPPVTLTGPARRLSLFLWDSRTIGYNLESSLNEIRSK